MIYISHLLPDEEMVAVPEKEKMGVESIDFSIGYCLDEIEKTIEQYRERLLKLEYGALSVHGPFLDLNPSSNDTLIRKVTKERFEQAYEAARELKADKIIYHSCFLPRVNFLEGWTDLMVPFWMDFLEDKDDTIQIHMENVFDPTYECLREVVEKVNHPAFSLCLDLGHANHASLLPITEWVEELSSIIGHIHIHDNDGITDGHLAVGEGNIPWEEVFATLGNCCPQVDYTIENARLKDVKQTLEQMGHHVPK